MVFRVVRTSHRDIDYPGIKKTVGVGHDTYEIELNSIEDLLNFQKAMGEGVIVFGDSLSLEVYDQYRE